MATQYLDCSPYTTTNAIFYGQKKFILIDPGPSEAKDQEILITRVIERQTLGHNFLGVALTHHHGDHTGAARVLSTYFNVPIWAHENASAQVPFTITKFEFPYSFNLGDDTKLHVIYTPGHSESHVIFYDARAQVLMAGDMITDRGTILIPPQSGSLRIYLQSLELISDLNIKILIPAHGKAITKNCHTFLQKALLHRYERIITILDTLKHANKSLDATDITIAVYQTTMSDALMFFSQLSVESSLLWLLEAGLAQRVNYKWIYEPNDQAYENILKKTRLSP